MYAWPHARELMNSFIRGEKVERGMRVKQKKVTVRVTELEGQLANCLEIPFLDLQ